MLEEHTDTWEENEKEINLVKSSIVEIKSFDDMKLM